MNIYQTWFTLYTFSHFDWKDSKNDDLIVIISGCNPYVWADDLLSADPAAWPEFEDVWGKDSLEKEISIEEAREKVKSYFKFYEKTGFNFGNLDELIPIETWNKYANVIISLGNKDFTDKKEWFELLKENKNKFTS